jgi:hypothetical protein
MAAGAVRALSGTIGMGKRTFRHPHTVHVCVRHRQVWKTSTSIAHTRFEAIRKNDAHTAAGVVRSAAGTICIGS